MTQFEIAALIVAMSLIWLICLFGYFISYWVTTVHYTVNIRGLKPVSIFFITVIAFVAIALTLMAWGDQVKPLDPTAPKYVPVNEQLYRLKR